MGILNALSYGGITAVIGLFIVFLGLTILIFAVKIMGSVIGGAASRKETKARAEAAAAAKAAPQAPAEPEPEPVLEEVTDNGELIAVIAAAIAAFDNSGKSLVVRRVRRVTGWNRTARSEQVYRF